MFDGSRDSEIDITHMRYGLDDRSET